jgi:hypothetical protein
MLQLPAVGGLGQSAFVVHVFVQIICIMIIWHWL